MNYDRNRIILTDSDLARSLIGKHIDVLAFRDGAFELRWQGRALPFIAFDKDQRQALAPIVENKRLGAALKMAKAIQAEKYPAPEPRTNSQKRGYRKTGRKSPGPPSKIDAFFARRRENAARQACEKEVSGQPGRAETGAQIPAE